jgi:hypothetical protein
MAIFTSMPTSPNHTLHRPGRWLAWSPLLVLGVSVMASVILISAGMAMISPEADAALAAAVVAR